MNFYFLFFAGLSGSIAFFLVFSYTKKAIKLLSLLLILFAYYFFYSVLYLNGSLVNLSFLKGTYYIPMSLFGTTFYLYFRYLLNYKKVGLLDLIHLTPFFLVCYVYGKFFFASSRTKDQIIYKALNEPIGIFNFLFIYMDYILIILMMFYAIKIVFLYGKFDFNNGNERIKAGLICLSFFNISVAFIIDYILLYLDLWSLTFDHIILFMISLFVSLISYLSIIKFEVSVFAQNGNVAKSLSSTLQLKYKNSGLTKSISIECKENLIKLMEVEKLYLNCDLKLHDVAKRLNLSSNHTSQVINENFKLSFNNYINKYRIIEAKKIMMNSMKDLTIENELNFTQVAYTVGFNNRASFYNAFKKFLNKSPKKFLESLFND